MPSLSVIVPTFNRVDDLKSLVALLKPLLSDLDELIVVNDASTDDTRVELNSLPVIPVNLDTNGGVGRARNEGARRAQGDILVFLDDDVQPDPNYFDQLRSLYEEASINVVQGPHHVARDQGWQQTIESIIWRADMEFIQVSNGNSATLHSQAFAIRRNVFESHQGFRSDFPGAGGEEFEFGARLLKKGHLTFVPTLLTKHRFEPFWPRLRTLFRRSRHWSSISSANKGWSLRHALTGIKLLIGGLSWCLFFVCLLPQDLRWTGLVLPALFTLLEWRTLFVGFRHGLPHFGIMAVMVKYVQYMVLSVGVTLGLIK